MKPEDVVIPEDALSESFLAATGPGGQNVNKVATAVQLRARPVQARAEPRGLRAAEAHRRQQDDAGRRAADHRAALRTQDANRQDARARLAQMIADAHIVQAKRTADPAEQGGQGQARSSKQESQRGAVKQRRAERWSFD